MHNMGCTLERHAALWRVDARQPSYLIPTSIYISLHFHPISATQDLAVPSNADEAPTGTAESSEAALAIPTVRCKVADLGEWLQDGWSKVEGSRIQSGSEAVSHSGLAVPPHRSRSVWV